MMPLPSRSSGVWSKSRIGGVLGPWLILGMVCGGFTLHPSFARVFWSADYLPNIAQQAATNVILAVGMTFVILTGGIDLSVGSVMALSGVTLGLAYRGGLPAFMSLAIALPGAALAGWMAFRLARGRGTSPRHVAAVYLGTAGTAAAGGWLVDRILAGGSGIAIAIAAALLVGAACGLVNGFVIAVGHVPSFVVTLGMLTAARGLTVYATDGNSVSGLPSVLGALGRGWPLVTIALAVVTAGVILQTRMRAGRYLQAIGANERATWLTGIDVPRYQTLAYLLSGLAAAVAAVVLTAKFQLADTGAGAGAELNAIAAVVIGGTSLSGGSGSVLGSLIGALTIAVLNAGLVLVGVKDTLQGVIIGAVIVLAVFTDRMRRA